MVAQFVEARLATATPQQRRDFARQVRSDRIRRASDRALAAGRTRDSDARKMVESLVGTHATRPDPIKAASDRALAAGAAARARRAPATRTTTGPNYRAEAEAFGLTESEVREIHRRAGNGQR